MNSGRGGGGGGAVKFILPFLTPNTLLNVKLRMKHSEKAEAAHCSMTSAATHNRDLARTCPACLLYRKKAAIMKLQPLLVVSYF